VVKPGETPEQAAMRQTLERASTHARQRLASAVQESLTRKREGLRLYDPMPYQDRYHQSTVKEVIFRAGNRCGKSIAGFVETARVVTNQDPYHKYPEKDGCAVCVGFKEQHIGMVIFPYLFKPGAFRVVFDKTLDAWRAWRPITDKPAGILHRHTSPSPPLIPERFVERFIWEKRGKNVVSRVDFTTGWELHCFSSRAVPAQGFQADYFHIDEDLEQYSWYSEVIGRLMDRGGKLRWTALPHSKNDALVNVVDRAQDEANSFANGGPAPSTVDIHATIYDNVYIDEVEKQEAIKRWRQEGEDVYRKRALGEMVTDSIMVYPSFSRSLHDAMREQPGMSKAREVFIESMKTTGQPPRDWMRIMALDPGHAFLAALFCAIPPPSLGFERFIYDEIYILKATARVFAQLLKKKVAEYHFQRFLIDAHGGAHSSFDTGKSPREAYSAEMRTMEIWCEETKEHFRSGVDDIAGREELLRLWMGIASSGEPTLFVHMQNCPNLVTEISRFKKMIYNDIVQDKANRRLRCHAIECLEYIAADQSQYIAPRKHEVKLTRAQFILKGMEERKQYRMAKGRRPNSAVISLGPPD